MTELSTSNQIGANMSKKCDRPPTPGTYILTHKPTGLYYIGATVNLRRRFSTHMHNIAKRPDVGPKAFKQFEANKEEFEFEFETFESVEEANVLEAAFLRCNVGNDLCINQSYGKGPLTNLSEETRRKLGDLRRGIARTPETKNNISLGKSRKVSLDGVVYASCYVAAAELGIGARALRQRLGAKTRTWRDWFFLENV